MIPNIMVKKLTTILTKRLKWFHVEVGVSQYYSPHIITNGLTLDDEKHEKIQFGDYV